MIIPRIVKYYVTRAGKVPFVEWFESLHDSKAKHIIDSRVTRIQTGNLGDCVNVGEGVTELRIHYGPGYRLYFGLDSRTLVILLIGGLKSDQKKDISKAREYWDDYLGRKKK